MSWLDWHCSFDWLTKWMNPKCHIRRCMPIFCISWVQILHQNQYISWLQISWDITLESKYLMIADFMRYYTKIKISHGFRFHEILHQNQNISWLQISWDITQESKYLMVADFMRYYTRTKTSHGCGCIFVFFVCLSFLLFFLWGCEVVRV